MNVQYAVALNLSQILTSLFFNATSMNTLFWVLFAPSVLQYNWIEIEKIGDPVTFQQATSAHYFKYTNNIDITSFLITWLIDQVFGYFMLNPLFFATAYFYMALEIVSNYSWYLILKLLTPWEEHQGEDILMWYVDAIDNGLYDPLDPPTSLFDY